MIVKKGDIIKVEYEGRLEDGQVFDSSRHGDHSHPLEFEVGAGQVIAGFDNAVVGMKKGEEKEIIIPHEKAYGHSNPNLKQKIPRSAIHADREIKAGMTIGLQTPEGGQLTLKVIETDAHSITVDMNHPLADKNLIFKIKIVEIKNKI